MKNKTILIKEVPLKVVLDIRREVMWPDKPISFVQVPGDEEAVHLGAFQSGILVSVVSVFIEQEDAQFRKFATLPAYQRNGYGTTLLRYVFSYLQSKRIKRVICNAREEKAEFYASFGMYRTPVTFQKEQVAYVVMEKLFET